jgi:hypothetical protein
VTKNNEKPSWKKSNFLSFSNKNQKDLEQTPRVKPEENLVENPRVTVR